MKPIKFVLFKPATADLYKDLPLFNAKCVYAVVSETAEDVVVETHPLAGYGAHSSKVVIAKTMIEKEDERLDKMLSIGQHYAFSPQLLDIKDMPANAFDSGMARDKEARPRLISFVGAADIHRCAIMLVPHKEGAQTSNHYVSPHWLVPPEEEKATKDDDDSPKKKKIRHPKDANDNGKIVRRLSDDRIFYIMSWDTFRGRFHLNDGVEMLKAAPTELEIIPEKALPKPGVYVTQSKRWLAAGQSAYGRSGAGWDTVPHVFTVRKLDGYTALTLNLVQTNGAVSARHSVCAVMSDIRQLTEEELAAVREACKTPAKKDEAWCRKIMKPALVRLIDTYPTSGFVAGLITAQLKIPVAAEFKTSREAWDAIIAQSNSIDIGEPDMLRMDMIRPMAIVEAGTGNIPVPAPATPPAPVPATDVPVPVAAEAVAYDPFDDDDDDDN